MADELAVPRLSAYGFAERHTAAVVAQARKASSMQGNPIELGEDELSAILAEAA